MDIIIILFLLYGYKLEELAVLQYVYTGNDNIALKSTMSCSPMLSDLHKLGFTTISLYMGVDKRAWEQAEYN